MDHSGSDFLQLDATAAPPGGIGDWLTATIRDAVADGRLAVGSRLPASRALAGQLGISRGIVVEAYRRLTDEGMVAGRGAAGTVVTAAGLGGPPPPTPVPVPSTPDTTLIDLRPGTPDLSSFPMTAWTRAERAALTDLSTSELGYGDPRGAPRLRAALASWLGRTRGIRTSPDELVVVNGVAQGLAVLAQVLTARGHTTVGFEDPGSAGTRRQLTNWGLTVEPIAVDVDGLDVSALAGSGIDTVVVTPAHQFPTGVVLAAARRRELVTWAGDGGLVIEDDYDAEHRYDRPPVAALHRMAPGRVAHVGSVSKTLAPALRLGWLVAPPDLRAEIVERKRWSDISSPLLGQLPLAELITSGGFEKHLRLTRTRYRERRNALLAALAEHLPGARVHGVAAGLHLLVTLPGSTRPDEEMVTAAEAAGVLVQAFSQHRARPGVPGFVIGYAGETPGRIARGTARLAAALRMWGPVPGHRSLESTCRMTPSPNSSAERGGPA